MSRRFSKLAVLSLAWIAGCSDQGGKEVTARRNVERIARGQSYADPAKDVGTSRQGGNEARFRHERKGTATGRHYSDVGEDGATSDEQGGKEMTISREGDGIARITSYPDLAKYVGTRVEIIGKPAGDHKGFGNFIPEIHDRSGPRAVRGPVTVIAPGATEAIRWPEAVIDRRLLVIGTLRSELLNKPKFAGMEAQGPRDGTVLYDVIDARYEPLDEAEGAGEEDAPGGITRITFFSDLVKHVGTRVEITGKPAEDLNGFGNFIPDLYDRIGTGLLLVDEPVTVVARGDAQPLHWPESAIGRRLRVIGTLKSATWKAKHGIPEQGPADGTVLYGLTDAWYELLDRAEGAREDGARKGE